MPEPVEIVPYDPRWPDWLAAIATPVAAALGSLLVTVEHVGSTAVPGLAAKPIIDVDVVVRAANVPAAIGRLATLGYIHQGRGQGFLCGGGPAPGRAKSRGDYWNYRQVGGREQRRGRVGRKGGS